MLWCGIIGRMARSSFIRWRCRFGRTVSANLGLGKVFGQRNDWNQAIAFDRRAIEINPVSSESYHCLGDVLFAKGAVEEAITAYRKAIELNPDSSLTYNSLGDALAKIGRLDEASACYRKNVELKA